MTDALKKTLWEGARIVAYAAFSAAVDYAQAHLLGFLPQGYITVIGTYGLKLAAAYIHHDKNLKSDGVFSAIFANPDLPM